MTTTPSHLRRLCAGLFALVALSFASAQEIVTTTLLDETFADGQRLVESLPGTAAWYGSAATTVEQPAAGSIVAKQVGANMHVFTHFTPSGSPYDLAVDETLNVSFNFNLTKALAGNTSIRIGVFNSLGLRVTDDLGGNSNANFNTDRGYGLFFTPILNSGANNLNLRVRNANNQSLLGSITPWVSMASSVGDISVADDRTYTVLLKITRTGAGVTVSARISGGELAVPISVSHSTTTGSQIFTSFDMFAICLLSTATSGTAEAPALLTLSNVKVTVDAPAPPPPPSANNLFLNDTFINGERTVENLPTTAAWYGSNSTLGQVADGSIRSTLTSATNQHLFTHFRPLNSPYPLTVGEKISVNFNFSLTKPVDNASGIRVGLLDSKGTRVSNDTTGTSSTAFADDRGYGVFFNPRSDLAAPGSISLYGRSVANNNLMTAVSAWVTPYATGISPLVMAAGQTYTFTLSVRRLENGALITVTISGGDLFAPVSLSHTHESATPFVSFDELAVAVLGPAHAGTVEDPSYLTISNVHIAATTLPDGVTSAQLFATWAASESVTFAGDANSDGVADGLAWLLGAPGASTNATVLLPFVANNNGGLDFAFSQITAATRGAARLRLQHSTDLTTWTTVTLPETSGTSGGITFTLTPDGGVDDVLATIPAGVVGSGGRFFVRLIGELEPAP